MTTTHDGSILRMVERGDEHVARDTYGDALVDAAIRADLEAGGWDADACFAGANGWGS